VNLASKAINPQQLKLWVAPAPSDGTKDAHSAKEGKAPASETQRGAVD
jgi:hypothetical protein